MMTNFKELFPDYDTYSNNLYLMNQVTSSLLREISNTLPKVLRDYKYNNNALNLDGTMRNICDKVSL